MKVKREVVEFVKKQGNATIYHTEEWEKVMKEAFKYTFYPLCVKKKGAVSGFLPLYHVASWITGNRLVAVPFRDRGGPLYSDLDSLQRLIERCKTLMEGLNCRSVIIKTLEPLPLNDITDLRMRSPYLRSILRLSTRVADVWRKLHKDSARWGVRKAEKSGVKISFGEDLSDLKEFYEIFFETRQRLGVPVFPFKLFKSIWEDMTPKYAKLILAKYRGEVIAGGIFFFYKKRATYAYTASKEEYLRFQPNNLLLWEGIKYSCERGFEEFDLGWTHRLQVGLLRFKSHWGTEHVPTFIYYLGAVIKLESATKSWQRQIWGILPKSLSRRMGPSFSAHFG